MLEVAGIKSSLHMAEIQVGLTTSIKLAQGKEVFVRSGGTPLLLQIDGEPWDPGFKNGWVLKISHRNQSCMLSPTREEKHSVMDKIGNVLVCVSFLKSLGIARFLLLPKNFPIQEWAEASSVINENQKHVLLMEMARRVKGDSHAPAKSAMLTATNFLAEATQAAIPFLNPSNDENSDSSLSNEHEEQ